MRRYRYGRFPEYVTVAEKKARAASKLKQLRKNKADISPIVIEGRSLARTWWGKSWNRNLERYADYSNRIGRGKDYVRHGAVLDLRIEKGVVTSLVQGTRAKPYEVAIRIAPVKKTSWKQLTRRCRGELDSLSELLAGKFPKDLGDIFLDENTGLFPTPKEIDFHCSCPDWAFMCKHVAATLYGVGARLDETPLLFFTLRQADSEALITGAIKETAGDLLTRAEQKSARVIDDADLSGLFGIDMEVFPEVTGVDEVSESKKSPRGKKTVAASRQITAERAVISATALIEELVSQHPNGVTVSMLAEATGFPRTKIYATTSRLRQQGRICYLAQGIYGPP